LCACAYRKLRLAHHSSCEANDLANYSVTNMDYEFIHIDAILQAGLR